MNDQLALRHLDLLRLELQTAIEKAQDAFFGAGGKELKTPAAMAKANVWFMHTSYPDNACAKGEKIVHTLRRYQFDKDSKLVGGDYTTKDYCGEPPKSAYK